MIVTAATAIATATTRSQIQSFVIDQYTKLFDEYQAAKALIPPGNLFEVKYEDFEADKMGQLRLMYEQFRWTIGEGMEEYVKSIRSFKKNRHKELGVEMKAYVREAWGRSFEVGGYD